MYIPASRLRPAYSDQPGAPNSSQPGVQQILLLPRVGKACVLCNWTVTFYSLPELSPIFGTTQVKNCHWIGGIDLNEAPFDSNTDGSNGVTILLSLNRRIQVVRIGDDARAYKVCEMRVTVKLVSNCLAIVTNLAARKSTLLAVSCPSVGTQSPV